MCVNDLWPTVLYSTDQWPFGYIQNCPITFRLGTNMPQWFSFYAIKLPCCFPCDVTVFVPTSWAQYEWYSLSHLINYLPKQKGLNYYCKRLLFKMSSFVYSQEFIISLLDFLIWAENNLKWNYIPSVKNSRSLEWRDINIPCFHCYVNQINKNTYNDYKSLYHFFHCESTYIVVSDKIVNYENIFQI